MKATFFGVAMALMGLMMIVFLSLPPGWIVQDFLVVPSRSIYVDLYGADMGIKCAWYAKATMIFPYVIVALGLISLRSGFRRSEG